LYITKLKNKKFHHLPSIWLALANNPILLNLSIDSRLTDWIRFLNMIFVTIFKRVNHQIITLRYILLIILVLVLSFNEWRGACKIL
jgi:hypothetical protein